ncbi:MAG: hypothetical protein ACOYYI_10895, partial [Chloroflexota bacterium]
DEACAVVFVAGAAAVGAVFAQKVAQGVGGVGGDDASGVDGRLVQTGDDMALRPKRVFFTLSLPHGQENIQNYSFPTVNANRTGRPILSRSVKLPGVTSNSHEPSSFSLATADANMSIYTS